MINSYEIPENKKESPNTVDQKTGRFDLAETNGTVRDANAEIASMEARGREDDLAKIRELEARTGINTDKSEGFVSAQIEKLKRVGKKMASVGIATLAMSGAMGGEKLAQAGERGSKDFDLGNFIREVQKREARQPEMVEEIRNSLINHIGSEEYLDKLKLEYDGNVSKARRAQELRVNMLRKVKINLVSKEEVARRWKSGAGDESRRNITDNISGFCTASGDAIYLNSEEVVLGMPVALHELLHASTKLNQYITDKARNLLDESFVEQGDGQDDYYRDSSERLARKQQLDRELEKLGVKGYGEEFTDEHFEKMMDYYNQGVLSDGSSDFIKRTNPEYFKQIFNEIASAAKPDLSRSADLIIEDENSPSQNEVSHEDQEQISREFESHMEEVEAKVREIKDLLSQRIGSQEYLERLKFELGGDEKGAQKLQSERMENLKQVKVEFISSGQMKLLYGYDDPRGGRVIAFYDDKEHKISFAHDQKLGDLSDSILHEFIHASMRQEKEMTTKAKEMLGSSYRYLTGKSQGVNEYLKNSGERMARKQQVDAEMEKLGIKKYGEIFTDEHYQKLKEFYESEKLSRGAKIFFETTKPEDFKKIFNEIAKTEDNQDIPALA